MQHRRIILASIIVGAVAVFGARLAMQPARAQDPTDTLDTERPLMRQKLDYSQKVLEGLTTNEMKLVIEGGGRADVIRHVGSMGTFFGERPRV